MDRFIPLLEIVTMGLNWFSIIILIWGVIRCAKDFFFSRFIQKKTHSSIESISAIKNELGAYVLLSLEVLIAADIIDSIANPALQDIFRLAAIVGIRTVISYFLTKEIKEQQNHEKSSQLPPDLSSKP